MQQTNISWADWTWNPVRGCSRISPGCKHCYAEKIANRFSGWDMSPNEWSARKESGKWPPFYGFAKRGRWTGKVELIEDKITEPLSWAKKAQRFVEEHGRRPTCFVNSMSDLFHEALGEDSIARVFGVMLAAPWIDFLVLTKRAERMQQFMSGMTAQRMLDAIWSLDTTAPSPASKWPLLNVWLGVSVESQEYADKRIPHLLRTPAAVRFLSMEPMLEGIDLRQPWSLDWVIVGGESGTGARPFDLAWARSIRDQCQAAGVAFYMKQVGSNPICSHDLLAHPFARQDIRDSSGEDPAEWPEDIRIQEVPR